MFAWLLLLIPLSLALAYVVHAPPLWVFVTATLAIVPLAEWIRRGTEQIARRIGPSIGGLLNVTFGNTAEFVLGIFVLTSGHGEVVKAQITGAIIGNSLLGLGLAIVAGSIGRQKQVFDRERVGLHSSLLVLVVIALAVPALFDYTEHIFAAPNVGIQNESLSLGVAIVLILVYVANLAYTLLSPNEVFPGNQGPPLPAWPLWVSLAVLVGATALTAVEAELVSGSLEATASHLGLTSFFLGIIVLALIGNVAEYFAAVYFARQDHMTLVLTITVGSTIQVALFVAPLLVLVSYFAGTPMNLVFANPLELIAVTGVAFIVNAIAHDGETTWIEGLLLIAIYAVLALAFFFVTPSVS